ncbi:hypothetical protein B0H14DRAFT_3421428 [Mycena olivaceomarginata]|nr:hypothetical protein B0H14DRAFT_3421428 [Mycena olivaceomarginata]
MPNYTWRRGVFILTTTTRRDRILGVQALRLALSFMLPSPPCSPLHYAYLLCFPCLIRSLTTCTDDALPGRGYRGYQEHLQAAALVLASTSSNLGLRTTRPRLATPMDDRAGCKPSRVSDGVYTRSERPVLASPSPRPQLHADAPLHSECFLGVRVLLVQAPAPVLPGRGAAGAVISPTRSLAARGKTPLWTTPTTTLVHVVKWIARASGPVACDSLPRSAATLVFTFASQLLSMAVLFTPISNVSLFAVLHSLRPQRASPLRMILSKHSCPSASLLVPPSTRGHVQRGYDVTMSAVKWLLWVPRRRQAVRTAHRGHARTRSSGSQALDRLPSSPVAALDLEAGSYPMASAGCGGAIEWHRARTWRLGSLLPPPPCPNYGVHHRTWDALSSSPIFFLGWNTGTPALGKSQELRTAAVLSSAYPVLGMRVGGHGTKKRRRRKEEMKDRSSSKTEGAAQAGRDPRQCFPKTGQYAPLLAHHDLAPHTLLNAPLVPGIRAASYPNYTPVLPLAPTRPTFGVHVRDWSSAPPEQGLFQLQAPGSGRVPGRASPRSSHTRLLAFMLSPRKRWDRGALVRHSQPPRPQLYLRTVRTKRSSPSSASLARRPRSREASRIVLVFDFCVLSAITDRGGYYVYHERLQAAALGRRPCLLLLAPALPLAPDAPDVGSLRIQPATCAPGLRSALAQVGAHLISGIAPSCARTPSRLRRCGTGLLLRGVALGACGGLLLDYHSVHEWVGGLMTENDAGVGRGMEEDGIGELKKSTGTPAVRVRTSLRAPDSAGARSERLTSGVSLLDAPRARFWGPTPSLSLPPGVTNFRAIAGSSHPLRRTCTLTSPTSSASLATRLTPSSRASRIVHCTGTNARESLSPVLATLAPGLPRLLPRRMGKRALSFGCSLPAGSWMLWNPICRPWAGNYAPGLVRPGLVAALHAARRRLSLAEVPPSPHAARALAHGTGARAQPRPHACAAARTLVPRWSPSRFRLRYTESLLLIRATSPLSRRPRGSGDLQAGGTFWATIQLASGLGGELPLQELGGKIESDL